MQSNVVLGKETMKKEHPTDTIVDLIEEYENRRQCPEVSEASSDLSYRKPRVGDFFYNNTTGELFVCHGRVNGRFKWRKVANNDALDTNP